MSGTAGAAGWRQGPRLAQAAAIAEQGHGDGVLPGGTLLAEWPKDAQQPTDYWLRR